MHTLFPARYHSSPSPRRLRGVPWYPDCRFRHTMFASAFTLLFIIFRQYNEYTFAFDDFSDTVSSSIEATSPSYLELIVVLVAVAFLGVPHGATDHIVAATLFQEVFPTTFLFAFVLVYLFLMTVVIVTWTLLPSVSLALFLTISIVHWGLGDVEEDLVPPRLRPIGVFELKI